MIECDNCKNKFSGWDAEVKKFGKSRKVCCPKCKNWIEYGRVVK
jgi:hypothetical protein